jgi:dTDP-glucose 4,6-dehydratase
VVNIGSSNEVSNIEVAKMILGYMNKPESLITYVTDRPGHDFRYSLTWERIREMGWKPEFKFEDGLRETVRWYLDNKTWWEPLMDL